MDAALSSSSLVNLSRHYAWPYCAPAHQSGCWDPIRAILQHRSIVRCECSPAINAIVEKVTLVWDAATFQGIVLCRTKLKTSHTSSVSAVMAAMMLASNPSPSEALPIEEPFFGALLSCKVSVHGSRPFLISQRTPHLPCCVSR